jgi:hypothetical protein
MHDWGQARLVKPLYASVDGGRLVDKLIMASNLTFVEMSTF